MPYKDSFFTLGGRYYDATPDVLWYDADNDEWIEMESKMKTPRSSHVALLVKESLFPDCS